MNASKSKLKRVKYKKEDDKESSENEMEEDKNSNKNTSPTNADDWLVRSYDDFIQQSVEVGSFLNFNTTNLADTIVRLSQSATIRSDDSAVTSANATTASNDRLVLIKYKKNADELANGGAKGNHLQQQKKHRELHSLLFFIFFLFVTIITLSQIIVMHSQTSNSNFYQIKLMQEELKLMDLSIDRMLKEKHVLPMQAWYALKMLDENLKKFSSFMDENFYSNETDANRSLGVSDANEQKKRVARFALDRNQLEKSLIDDLSTCNSTYALDLVRYLRHNESLTLLVENLNELVLNWRANDSTQQKQQDETDNASSHCMQLTIDALFFIFNQKYSQLVEANVLAGVNNKNELVNKAFNESNTSAHYLAPSLRNMEAFLLKYKKSFVKFNPNVKVCNPQPPVLCKLHNFCSLKHKFNKVNSIVA
jgi:hypothetical protein